MNAAAYLGRVGGLAVALGVGAAMVTGNGCALAWADGTSASADGSASSPDSDAAGSPDTSATSAAHAPEPTANTSAASDTDDASVAPPTSQTTADAPADTDETTAPSPAAPGDVVSTGGAHTSSSDEAGVEPAKEDILSTEEAPEPTSTETTEQVTDRAPSGTSRQGAEGPAVSAYDGVAGVTATESSPQAPQPAQAEVAMAVNSVAAQPSSSSSATFATTSTSVTITPSVTLPSLRLWPTAFDPITVVSYAANLFSSLVNAAMSPFLAGAPALPADPWPWTLLAWARRELFNESPVIAYDATQNVQDFNDDGDVVVTGSIGASDPDGDPITITLIGRPVNGGTVEIDSLGNFVYRPMNAMAAVGGTDSFTVVVNNQDAGLHVHGPLGLLQFVPILGNFVNPGAGHGVAQTITVDVTPVDGVDLTFPEGFHWGVATAGFQVEGGPGSPVDPNSDWYKWVHDPINQALGLTKGVPEDGPGEYVLYQEDADLAKNDLGMNTFRMGIEWSRIFPNSTAAVNISDGDGTVSLADLEALDQMANQDEVAHYAAVLAALRATGLEPVVTVNHFTLPLWVHDPTTTRLLGQVGLPAPATGWLSADTPVEFEKFAAYLAWKYGEQVDNWVVLNEPFPPMLTQYFSPPIPGFPAPYWPPGIVRPDLASTYIVNETKGYVGAYDAIHQWDTTVATDGQPAAFVGFANHMIPARPANPVNPLDVQAANAWTEVFNRWFPNAVTEGWVDANLDGIRTPDEIHPEFANKLDFLAVQYYGSQPMTGLGLAPLPGMPWLQGFPGQCDASSPTCTDFGQTIDAGGFRQVLEIAAEYGKPIWITENGIADDDDTKRPSYLTNHIAVVQDMLSHGTDIVGYTHWSLVDNLEWSSGYNLKFGLYSSDTTTPELERIPKPASISVISQITTSNSLPESLLATYIPQP